MSNGGTIYAIGAEGTSWVKIGSTTGPVVNRVKLLQTGQPFVLYLVASVQVAADVVRLEKRLHRLLDSAPCRGEWFEMPMTQAQLLALVEQAQQVLAEEVSPAPAGGLATRVETLRRDKGWTKAELARRSHLHEQHIYKVLAGDRRHVSPDTLIALARALGVTPNDLLGWEEMTHA